MERKQNLAEIKRRLEKRRTNSEIVRFLEFKGIEKSLASEIYDACDDHTIIQLNGAIAKRIISRSGFTFTPGKSKRIALVGPTGVGKTTTLLKLASRYQKEGKTVALLTLDDVKGGALEQIQQYSKKWNIPLCSTVESAGPVDLLLIDTGGCNYYLPDRIDQLGERLAAIDEIEIHLTLSATTKEVDLYRAIYQFSALNPASLIFTKLDETLAPGVLVNICAKMAIPISYIAFGYPLPGELQPADPEEIAHKILVDLNHENYHFIRQLSI